MSRIQQHAIHTLLYFDIFKYPLRNQEIFKFLRTNHLDEETLRNEVESLVSAGLVHRFGEFYSITGTDDNVERRLRGNQLAALSLPNAQRQARLIARFPFVRGVMASGSLSKGYMDTSSDLDFFIVTSPGRLWIARTLLVLYKRMFLGNSHKHFCVNYFVDANHLEIADKNIFTATELATLLPLWNAHIYHKLLGANPWLFHFFPNFRRRELEGEITESASGKKVLEQLIEWVGVGWLDRFCMKLTQQRWRRHYANAYSKQDMEVAFRSTRHVSKNHPNHYQQKVTMAYQEKIEAFAHRHSIEWS